ncbi:lipopolysaccharide biosynthesis protein [sulfur-oxidizing endosymbiont of Gigantopelta aegis]|uniref:lipopolysaccharide biosynthesis protein n=1 Tax=sulfur-oxidizing endosymbiont of Gigantopelta aegis TaxID=2794934 RepID=UPI0018DD66CE|nr:oligosaccharide flippase family protein [sulfur-oxidizing endosymbiont of Gigantopelta aegis]
MAVNLESIKLGKVNLMFFKNVLTLMAGSSIAQALPIAISPILTRIYTPDEFGIFALYLSIVTVISTVVTGRYELAILLPKKTEDANNILIMSILISFFVSFMLVLIVFKFDEKIIKLIGNPELKNWLYFIPLAIFLNGVYQNLICWNNRNKEYKRLAINNVIQSSTTATTNLGLGALGWGSGGLILGSVIGRSVVVLLLGKVVFKNINLSFNKTRKLKLLALMRRYNEFPKINSLHALLNVFSTQLPFFLISYFFYNTVTGFYALMNRVLMTPINIVSGSFGQVFFQEMSHLYVEKNTNEMIFFKKIMFRLLVWSLPFFVIFFIYSKDLFSFVFGENWSITGEYAQILLPMLYLRFTGSVMSSVVIIYDEQKKH